MMSKLPLHLARVSEIDPEEIEVIDTYDKARGFVEVAIELWRLAGREDRAAAIEDVMVGSIDHEPRRLERPQIEELRRLLDGLEQALVGTVTDEQHVMSEAKVEELRGRTETLDYAEWRGKEGARYAVQEALIYVDHLRSIADEALATPGASLLFN